MDKRYELLIQLPSGTSVRYPLMETVIRVGRSASNELCLPDEHLSRIHAILRRDKNRFTLEDQGSRNGTTLNEKRIQDRAVLKPGDRIRIGKSVLIFEEAGEISPPAQKESETLDILSDEGSALPSLPDNIVAESPAMQQVVQIALKASRHNAPVLLVGESGTGKEVIARLIHGAGLRSKCPFVAVNCPALPSGLVESELFGVEKGVATGVDARAGKFEQAGHGTLFLDEIGDMEPQVQAKLLRVIEESVVTRIGGSRPIPLDFRLIAATNHRLEEDMAAGRFREDLYYRLNTIRIQIPPLRDRREDIVPLLKHFLSLYGGKGMEIAPEAGAILRQYRFPGNVRELEQWVRRLLIFGKRELIGADDLLEEMRKEKETAPDRVERVYRKVVDEGGDFWELVRKPYLSRELTREEVRKIIAMGRAASGGNYRDLSVLFGIEKDYKKFLNFLRNHQLQDEETQIE